MTEYQIVLKASLQNIIKKKLSARGAFFIKNHSSKYLNKICKMSYHVYIGQYLALNIVVKDLIQMKNIIKKILATAMAFTLLGTDTTMSKEINPKSANTLSAHAAHHCNYNRVSFRYGCYIVYSCSCGRTYATFRHRYNNSNVCIDCGYKYY